MIGNDIIDLKLAKKESNYLRAGFLEKQFSSNEQAIIKSTSNTFLLVWRLWSMKEAAYKVYTQQNETRFFAPKKFDCLISSDLNGFVYDVAWIRIVLFLGCGVVLNCFFYVLA